MDRETEKRLRHVEQDIQAYEQALRGAEDNVVRLISKLGGLRGLKFKIESHEALKEAEQDGAE